jgi:hypothetical protein
LFRPFPFEVNSIEALVASAEGTLLLVLLVRGKQRVLSAVRRVRKSGFMAFILLYLVFFVAAYSSFSNFGLLARQRVLALPLLLIVLALPARRSNQIHSTAIIRPY